MKITKKITLFLPFLLLFCALRTQAQTDTTLVQFSGIVLTNDSLKGMPFVSIMLKGSWRGTISDMYGYFSLVARKGDSVVFSTIGYKTAYYVVPKFLKEKRYSIVQLMTQDTIIWDPGAVVYPWPKDIDKAIVSLNVPDQAYEIARKNLEREKLKELSTYLSMDGRENQRYYMRQQVGSYYYAGQQAPQNIFSPIAWAQFIEAWKRGDFKRKR